MTAALIFQADTTLMLARVFNNSPDFWLNVQRPMTYGPQCTLQSGASA